jgi:Putative prokaryotic signal transducing protein
MVRRAKVIRFPKSPPVDPTPSLVEVHRCRDQSEALVVRGLLESEGIQVVLRSNLAQSVYPFSVGRQAEVILLAHQEDAVRARAILARR